MCSGVSSVAYEAESVMNSHPHLVTGYRIGLVLAFRILEAIPDGCILGRTPDGCSGWFISRVRAGLWHTNPSMLERFTGLMDATG